MCHAQFAIITADVQSLMLGDMTHRYDVRGALSELAQHEPPPGGYGNRLDYLSADEQRAEQLCEEERYLYLYNNEEDHILQQGKQQCCY